MQIDQCSLAMVNLCQRLTLQCLFVKLLGKAAQGLQWLPLNWQGADLVSF